MNTSPLLILILFFLSTCHGKEHNDSLASGILATTKGQKVKTSLEVSCPEPTDIEPCECSNDIYLTMDCSKVQDEEQLRKIFSAFFPRTDFDEFYMWGNTGLKVLEDGVFGNVSFQEVYIRDSALQVVRNDTFTASLSTLTSISIQYCQLAIFPFERLAEFTSLAYLSLYINKIHSLPPLSSSSLLFLHLGHNPITHLSPDVFTLLPAIQSIFLYGCNVTEITPGTFSGLPELSTVHLADNKISYLQSLTFDLASLPPIIANLFLDRNRIDVVEVDAFKGVPEDSVINMANNALTTLEEEVWKPVLEKVNYVGLEGNDLLCDCAVAWLVRDPQLLTVVSDAHCADGTLLTDLNPDDFDICS